MGQGGVRGERGEQGRPSLRSSWLHPQRSLGSVVRSPYWLLRPISFGRQDSSSVPYMSKTSLNVFTRLPVFIG